MSYYNHFRKDFDFIRPCALAHDERSYDNAALTRRPNNSELELRVLQSVNRPQIAISEFAETLLANFKYLEENKEILDQESLN